MTEGVDPYYDQEGLWRSELSGYQESLLRDVRSVIPSDCRRILDVGCGDGKLTNVLAEDLEVEGVDGSVEALKSVRCTTRQGTLPELPYDDASFDLVLAIDVLEHIPAAIWQAALDELRRISRRYVLVAFPFAENLRTHSTLCLSCGRLYHINHHVRRSSFGDLFSLYPESSLRQVCFSGAWKNPGAVLDRELRDVFWQTGEWDKAMCPHCGVNASHALFRESNNRMKQYLRRQLDEEVFTLYPNLSEVVLLFDFSGGEGAVPNVDGGLEGWCDGGERISPTSSSVVDGKLRQVYESEVTHVAQRLAGVSYSLCASPQPEVEIDVPLWFVNLDVYLADPERLERQSRELVFQANCRAAFDLKHRLEEQGRESRGAVQEARTQATHQHTAQRREFRELQKIVHGDGKTLEERVQQQMPHIIKSLEQRYRGWAGCKRILRLLFRR